MQTVLLHDYTNRCNTRMLSKKLEAKYTTDVCNISFKTNGIMSFVQISTIGVDLKITTKSYVFYGSDGISSYQ